MYYNLSLSNCSDVWALFLFPHEIMKLIDLNGRLHWLVSAVVVAAVYKSRVRQQKLTAFLTPF